MRTFSFAALIEEGPLAAGAFYRPSLIEVEDLNAYVVQNEVFGPVQTFEILRTKPTPLRAQMPPSLASPRRCSRKTHRVADELARPFGLAIFG